MGRLKSLSRRWNTYLRRETSLTDKKDYRRFCLDAAASEPSFRTFRRHPSCVEVVETVTAEQGQSYLDILSANPSFKDRLEEIRRNDAFGRPHLTEYPGIGGIAPTTLRYAKVYDDLVAQLGSLDGLRICEIGIGYGGQCRLVDAFSRPSLYRLVDLPPALGLAQRYLSCFDLRLAPDFRAPDALAADRYDLVISNYAFSELRRVVQEDYLCKIISSAAHGYLTCNFIVPAYYDAMTESEYMARIPGARVLPEVPETHRLNRVVVW